MLFIDDLVSFILDKAKDTKERLELLSINGVGFCRKCFFVFGFGLTLFRETGKFEKEVFRTLMMIGVREFGKLDNSFAVDGAASSLKSLFLRIIFFHI